MDRLASTGMVGRSNNVPASLTPASDVATLSLFGYDPLVVYTGRAPLETVAMGLTLGPATGPSAATWSTSTTKKCATSPPGTSRPRTAGR